eukprot:353497-Chlamydomonas_euryale.AAC.4
MRKRDVVSPGARAGRQAPIVWAALRYPLRRTVEAILLAAILQAANLRALTDVCKMSEEIVEAEDSLEETSRSAFWKPSQPGLPPVATLPGNTKMQVAAAMLAAE